MEISPKFHFLDTPLLCVVDFNCILHILHIAAGASPQTWGFAPDPTGESFWYKNTTKSFARSTIKEFTIIKKQLLERRNWGGKLLPIFPSLPGYATRCGRFNRTRSFIGCWGSTSGSTRPSALSSSAPLKSHPQSQRVWMEH